MSGPATYRRGKMIEVVQRLIWRKEALISQLDQPELEDMKPNIIGQIQALDLVIRELIKEFEIEEEELK